MIRQQQPTGAGQNVQAMFGQVLGQSLGFGLGDLINQLVFLLMHCQHRQPGLQQSEQRHQGQHQPRHAPFEIPWPLLQHARSSGSARKNQPWPGTVSSTSQPAWAKARRSR